MLLDPRTMEASRPAPVMPPARPAAPFLEMRGIAKSFGSSKVLDDISLTLREDELVCLLGPSGCGKTTLLRILCGIEPASAGRVLLQGDDITDMPPGERRFGIVFQSYALFPNLTALRNVAYGLHGVERGAALKRSREMLELVGLAAHADKHPAQLSGGQQQRVALARALAPRPSLLLLDEPLSALDAQVRANLRGEIRRLQQQLRMPTVMVTHDQDEALAMADRVVLMNGGRIVQDADPWALYARPADSFVARFVGRMNLWRARAAGPGHAEIGGLTLEHAGATSRELADGAPVLLAMRPEAVCIEAVDLAVLRSPQLPALPRNVVRAELIDWTFCGAHVSLACVAPDLGGTVEVSLPTPSGRRLAWTRGETLHLRLPREALSVLPADAA
jgi:iron(III) transport system ATP-binding protein